ncbi:MAG: phosphatase PAP2 family protein [Nitrospirae bacterium]|nr:MAG: phosphatase PAP2 family protein [Nitrospirota bacterium]
MPLRRWIESANNAIEGIIHAAKTQRHVRYHLYSASTVLIVSFILGVTKTEFLIIAILALLVILAEMLNSAMENMVDLLSPEIREKARIIKDISAGAVLISAFGAAIAGYIILMPYIKEIFHSGLRISEHTGEDIAIVSLVLVLILVVITKARFGKGHPLRGGMPSGHAALAFSIWVSITYISENFVVSLLGFIGAFLIAQSRITIKAHTPWEVILGALVGASTTFLLFKIFS